MRRTLVTQLAALAVVTAVGVGYIAFDVIGVHVGHEPYHVTWSCPRAPGDYQRRGRVTYRGVEVGKVASLHFTLGRGGGARYRPRREDSGGLYASVKELTAAAEQYMDIVPPTTDPPYLQNGSVIPMDHTSVPVSVGQLLNTVNSLVNSLHASDLNTLTESLAQGLQGAGPDLRSIIVNGDTLITALQSAIPGTRS